MFCRYCGAELNRKDNICPVCGKNNTPKKMASNERKRINRKRLTTVIVCVLAVALLIPAVYFGVKGILRLTAPNDVYYKDSYTVSNEDMLKHRDTVVATLGDHTLTNGQLQVFYSSRVHEFMNQAGSYGYMFGLDYTKPLHEQIYDEATGKTWQHMFLERALMDWKSFVMMSDEAEKAGYKLEAEYQEYVDNLYEELKETAASKKIETVEEFLDTNVYSGCTFEDYKYYVKLYYIGQSYYDHLVSNTEVSAGEMDTYFTENAESLKTNFEITKDSGLLVDVRHILIMPEGATTETITKEEFDEDAWAYAEKKANEILKQWKSGEMTEQSFVELALENSQDDGSKDRGGLYSDISATSSMVKPFLNWCMDESREAGDTGIIKTVYGYHVMYYISGEEGWIVYSRDGVRSEKISKFLEELSATYEAQIDYKKIAMVAQKLL